MNALLVLLLLCPAAPADDLWPGKQWPRPAAPAPGLDEAALRKARDYALTGGGSGLVIYRGRQVIAWGDPDRRYDLKSTTKSFGATALGLAVTDGKMKLDDKAVRHHPAFGVPPETNRAAGWLDQVTLLHLATQTAGFEKPGGYRPLLFRPGTKWHYSDGGPNWLAECVTLAYRRDLNELMFERVFTPLGIRPKDLTWRKNAYRPAKIDGITRREFGSGISADVDAMARIGYLYLREGRWRGKQILSREFVATARTTVPQVVGLPEHDAKSCGNTSAHYGLLWWNNADGTLSGVPRDAYWSWGLYDSLIVVIPSLDLVAARAGKSWKRTGGDHYDVLKPFLGPLAASVYRPPLPPGEGRGEGVPPQRLIPGTGRRVTAGPHPPSRVITSISWAPASTIVRAARGSDNWPITWGDDDALYTAYGDGWGFDPRTPGKLSLGLARITGPATEFAGVNVRSVSGEQRGDGPSGKKASGMLMVDGVLYMLVRNAGVSQIAWSKDRGRTWTWSKWRFTESFGCPTFLNFGRDYAGARDEFVYVYSPDATTAYEPADRMVLARVPRDRIAQRKAYEFFVRLDRDGSPAWSKDIAARGAVFASRRRCGRSSVSFNAPLERYLWVQVLPAVKARQRRGLAVYDAPQPWGPWNAACLADPWDVDPGESAAFPTKWISADGRTLYLVFSGEDSFSVRKAELSSCPTSSCTATCARARAGQEQENAGQENVTSRAPSRAATCPPP